MNESLSDAEKLHRVKLLAQEWYDEGCEEAWAGEEILKIIDPDNSRLQPPPPPTEEEKAAAAERHRLYMEKVQQDRLDYEAVMKANYHRKLAAIHEEWDIDERGIATRKPSD